MENITAMIDATSVFLQAAAANQAKASALSTLEAAVPDTDPIADAAAAAPDHRNCKSC